VIEIVQYLHVILCHIKDHELTKPRHRLWLKTLVLILCKI